MPMRRNDDDDDDATVNDVPSLCEDFGNYDSHEENDDDTFPELNFAQQYSRVPVTRESSNLATSSVMATSTSTPLSLPEQQEYALPTYDEVIRMDSSLNTPNSSATHHYPDESTVTHRYKKT